ARARAAHAFAHRARLRVPAVAGAGGRAGRQHVAESGLEQLRAAAGDVDELADQVAVHAGDEVRQVQVEVVDAAGGLGGEVVAQRLRVQAAVEVGARHHEGAARLAHLGPVHRQVAVDVQPVGQ